MGLAGEKDLKNQSFPVVTPAEDGRAKLGEQ